MRVLPQMLAVILVAAPARAEVAGPAHVIDGDTIEVGSQRVDLHAIDAPEIGQVCSRAGVAWACGEAAAELLRELTRNQHLVCEERGRVPGNERDGAVLARCKADWLDLGAEMVTRGLAVADFVQSDVYLRNHQEARGKGNGIFGGVFVAPAEWRKGKRLPIETLGGATGGATGG